MRRRETRWLKRCNGSSRPLWRPGPAGHARAARRRPRAAVARARRRDRRALVEGTEGAGVAGAGIARRAPTCTATSTSPAARGASSASPSRWSAPCTHGRDRARTRWQAVPAPAAQQPRATSRTTTTSRNAFYRIWLDERMVYSCAYFRRDDDTLDAAQVAEARPHLPQAAARARRALPRHRLRLGRAPVPRGGALRRRGARASRCRRTSSSTCARRSPRAGSRAACAVELRDYLDLPEDVQYDKIASVGMFEHVGRAPASRRTSARSTACSKPGGMVLNHGITHNSLDARQPGQRHRRLRRRVRVPRRRAHARGARDRGHGGAGPRTASTPKRCASTTRRRCGTGSTGWRRTRTRRAREVGDERYRDLAHLHGRARRTRSTAAGCRCGSCWRASRSPTAACRIR